MSTYLPDVLRKGDMLLMHLPLGDLDLAQNDGPIVLLSGGSGITPT